jgi:phosphate transport system substrate-binding protein
MDNKKQRTYVIQGDILTFLRGLIIGKVMTLVVISGLFWWLVRPMIWSRTSVDSSRQSSETASNKVSTFQTVADVPINTFKYGGSATWMPIRQVVDSQIQSDRPELQLHYIKPTNGSPSSTSGIRMLLDGQIDFAQSSRPLSAEENAMAKQRGFTLEQRQVGMDAIAVVVNPSLKVPGLTIKQLQQIYSGQITNWKLLGGSDLPITPVSQRPEDIDTDIFSANTDSNKPALSANVQYVNSITEGLRQVNKTRGAIYYASARAVVPQCSVKPLPVGRTPTDLIPPYRDPLVKPQQCPHQRNQINTAAIKNGSYPMTTTLYVIVKHNQGPQQQAGDAYAKLLLTDQGQKAIEQAGFVTIGN